MSVKLLPEQHICRFYASNEAVQARPSLHLSKCYIVGIHMSFDLDLSCEEFLKQFFEILEEISRWQ